MGRHEEIFLDIKIPCSGFENGSGSKTSEPISNEAPPEGPSLGCDDSNGLTTNTCLDADRGRGKLELVGAERNREGDRYVENLHGHIKDWLFSFACCLFFFLVIISFLSRRVG